MSANMWEGISDVDLMRISLSVRDCGGRAGGGAAGADEVRLTAGVQVKCEKDSA